MNRFMKMANEKAKNGMLDNEGGPFGAVIIDGEGNVIATGNNQVFKNNDPTAHAEIQAIRNACKKLNTYVKERIQDEKMYYLFFDEIQSSKELKLLQGAGHFPIEEKGLKQLEEYCIAFMNR